MPSNDSLLLFALLGVVLALLLWGRWRYDLVAFGGLVAAVLLGLVPEHDAFSGFGHEATVVVALVLVISRGLERTGVVERIAALVVDPERLLALHLAAMCTLAATLSAVMNNVAALALLMPLELEAAKRAGRSPAVGLMPLSFASILGGMVTMIGTPPNIVVASYRGELTGEPFGMFDFTPVGLAVALLGTLFVATVGWRLLPKDVRERDPPKELLQLGDYLAVAAVKEEAKAAGVPLYELARAVAEQEGRLLEARRAGRRLRPHETLQPGDRLLLEAPAEALERIAAGLGLELGGRPAGGEEKAGEGVFLEAVVPADGRLVGRTLESVWRFGLADAVVVGLARAGERRWRDLARIAIRPGDVLLLFGPEETVEVALERYRLLPLAPRGLERRERGRAPLAVGVFAAAVLAASLGWTGLPVALAAACVVYVAGGIVPLRELYESIEWPVVVLLGSMLPIGAALEASGGTAWLAGLLADATAGLPPLVALAVLMVLTMSVSDLLNNTVTAVIAAPVAADLAARLGASPDPFLMGVAVASSCAFLTPIGHKNNVLVMGPGGYRFGDYWRMGLPLELLVLLVAVPLLPLVFPFRP